MIVRVGVAGGDVVGKLVPTGVGILSPASDRKPSTVHRRVGLKRVAQHQRNINRVGGGFSRTRPTVYMNLKIRGGSLADLRPLTWTLPRTPSVRRDRWRVRPRIDWRHAHVGPMVALALACLLISGCGKPDDGAAVAEVARDYGDALAHGSPVELCKMLTVRERTGVVAQSSSNMCTEAIRSYVAFFTGSQPGTPRAIRIRGDRASVVLPYDEPFQDSKMQLRRENGRWKVGR